MQVAIALPDANEIDRLETPVCGVPLLARVMTTALRCGVESVLLVAPSMELVGRLSAHLHSACPVSVELVVIGHVFDPSQPNDWRAIAHRLDERFLWAPYDYLVHRRAMTELLAAASRHPGAAVRFCGALDSGADRRIFDRPTVLRKCDCIGTTAEPFEVVPFDGQPGVSARPPASVHDAEVELVRRSGKVTDGIYSRFNRWLCRPAVRWLSHTRVTPNAVSLGGLAVAALGGLAFTQGSWAWDVVGAALFFLSGLFDEVDGMLARLRFQESAFGCWLETMADYSSYLLIFAGMTAGGYRRGGWVYLAMGGALLFGCVLSFAVISIQRRLAAPVDRPNEYSRNYLKALERDRGNPISRTVRQLQFLTKKGVLIHYLLLLTALGALPVAMFLSSVGANIAWAVTIYFNRRLFLPSPRQVQPAGGTQVEVER